MISLCDTFFFSVDSIEIEPRKKEREKKNVVPELNVAQCDPVYCVIDGNRPAGHSLCAVFFFSVADSAALLYAFNSIKKKSVLQLDVVACALNCSECTNCTIVRCDNTFRMPFN